MAKITFQENVEKLAFFLIKTILLHKNLLSSDLKTPPEISLTYLRSIITRPQFDFHRSPRHRPVRAFSTNPSSILQEKTRLLNIVDRTIVSNFTPGI